MAGKIEFDPMDYAVEHYNETLNYMNDDELTEIYDYDNEDDLDDYLRCFSERV